LVELLPSAVYDMAFIRLPQIRRRWFGATIRQEDGLHHFAECTMRRRRSLPAPCLLVVTVFVALAAGGCHGRSDLPPKPRERAIGYHLLGSWSGRGSLQTESFTSDTGALRVRWETNLQPGDDAAVTTGALRITAHSAISGRPLQEVVNQKGVGRGVGYVQQDPHVFYLVVDSSHADWKFTVEEAIVY
jgi:hypothetical protein